MSKATELWQAPPPAHGLRQDLRTHECGHFYSARLREKISSFEVYLTFRLACSCVPFMLMIIELAGASIAPSKVIRTL